MSKNMSEILKPVDEFFSNAVTQYGAAHKAADYPDPDQQIRRFVELSRLFDISKSFNVLDYGCGYGAMLDHLISANHTAAYWGYDICKAMLTAARDSHPGMEDRFLSELPDGVTYDYVVASGIFSLKMEIPLETWDDVVHETIDKFDTLSLRGFAFNMLTSYREPHRKRSRLYYGDPLHFFDLCFRKYSPNIALTHDYNLWDFTIIVRKSP
jgi:SAM-dependent methyltransferase